MRRSDRGGSRGLWRLALAVICAVWLAGCSTPVPTDVPQVSEPAYSAAYPTYFEFCALSEIQKKPGYGADIRGGVGGHSTIYLNGACLVGDGRQMLRLCDARDGPDADGVGLSVNAHFVNANWVAIPGRRFFYHGDLRPGQRLTHAVYDETKAHAARIGLYDGVRFHDRVFENMPPGFGREAYKYEVSIGTDYAVSYARDRYCARIPLSIAEMSRMIAYLNLLNRPYQAGEAVYEWSVVNDNCIHVAHNALSYAGFWPPWPTHRWFVVAALDFPVPKNEFVNIMRRANDLPVDDLPAVWADKAARAAVLRGDDLPTRPGAIANFEPVAQDNDVYNTDLQLIFYDEAILLGQYEGRYRHIVADRRYTRLPDNQAHFARLYAEMEAHRQPLSWWAAHWPRMAANPEFPAFYHAYYAATERSAAAVAGASRSLALADPHAPAAGAAQN